MKTRPRFMWALVSGFVALAVVVAPVIADELIGVLTKVDVAGKKVTVEEKDTNKEVVITITDNTEYVTKGESAKIDLDAVAKRVDGAKEKGKKGINVVVTHEKGVASKITPAKKKAAN